MLAGKGLLKKGDLLQLQRKGYYICDVPYGGSADKPAVLFSIPDGRTNCCVQAAAWPQHTGLDLACACGSPAMQRRLLC